MSMSDCIKCWTTPCCCGWEYKNYSKEGLSKHIANITQYRTKEDAKEIIIKAIEEVEKNKNWCDDNIPVDLRVKL